MIFLNFLRPKKGGFRGKSTIKHVLIDFLRVMEAPWNRQIQPDRAVLLRNWKLRFWTYFITFLPIFMGRIEGLKRSSRAYLHFQQTKKGQWELSEIVRRRVFRKYLFSATQTDPKLTFYRDNLRCHMPSSRTFDKNVVKNAQNLYFSISK